MNKLPIEFLKAMSLLLKDRFVIEKETLYNFASDHTEDLVFVPDAVAYPNSTQEVAEIVKLCSTYNIPITTRGAGTGLSGGALAVNGGLVLSTHLLNKILHVDTENMQVHTQPGVITEHLQNEVKKHNLYYPPDPASKGSCFIGGNIAENSGGPKAAKYGVVKDYVLNLEVVLANGDVIWTGANTLKNVTGYNLTQLIVGSEGTLGIVTTIVLRLIPLPDFQVLLLCTFNEITNACLAVNKIYQLGIQPSALEFMETDAILLAQQYTQDYTLQFPLQTQALLLIELEGNYIEVLNKEAEKIQDELLLSEATECWFAHSEKEKNTLWNLRRNVGNAVKKLSTYKEEDTVVPRNQLPNLVIEVKKLCKQYNINSVCYGHAGDGNLHINLLKKDMEPTTWQQNSNKLIIEIFEAVKKLGGTLTGEHGVGWVQKPYLSIFLNDSNIALQKQIKLTFDPQNILNPNKIF